MRTRSRGILTATALLLVGTVLALGGLEVGLRFVNYRPALQSGWMITSPFLALDDDVIIIPRTLLAPAFYDRTGDAPLIVTIGDSFTQSFPVAAEDSYPAVLERRLAARGLRTEVMNAGMGDTGPDQQLRFLETRVLPRLHPKVVIWSLYANDLWDGVLKPVYAIEGTSLVPQSGATNWIARRQRLYDRAPLPASIKQQSYLFHLLLKATELGSWAAIPRADADDPTAWALRKLTLELARFRQLAADHGFAGYLVLIAPQSTYLAETDPAAWSGWWSAVEHHKLVAALRGRPDLIEAWFGAAHAADIFVDGDRDQTNLGERHFNETGYALLADAVAKRLLDDRVIDAGAGRGPAASPTVGPIALAAPVAVGAVEQLDPDLATIVPPTPVIERVATGFRFIEGPVWVRDGGYLLFSDLDRNCIQRWTPDGALSVHRPESGYSGSDVAAYRQPGSNGLTLDREGRLTIGEHGNRRVTRLERDGEITVLADRYDGKRLNSPNDLVYKSDGALYFTDPPFGVSNPRRELPYSGVYRVAAGQVQLLTTELSGPNGLAFSPDERLLYIANWDAQRRVVMRYPVRADGTLAAGTVFFDLAPRLAGYEAFDGLKVDRDGNVYVAAPGGVWILSPDGRHLGTIRLPEQPANLGWGDTDGRTLYITARTSLYRVQLAVPGVRP